MGWRWTRRQRIHAALGGAMLFVGLAVAGLWLSRAQPAKYVPGEDTEGITRSLERGLPADTPPVRFTDVTAEAGIDFRHFEGRRSNQLPEDMGSGAAWGDYDGDGRPDLYVVNVSGPLTAGPAALAASPASNRLYHNLGGGRFEDVTEAAGVGLRGMGMGAAWADYDNDGDQDLLSTAYGTNHLFRNQGGGRFEEVSAAAGLAGPEGFWTGVGWADYDRDGDLDAYVGNYVAYAFDPADLGRSSRQYGSTVPVTLNPSAYDAPRKALYRNDGDGRFTDVAAVAGVTNPGGRTLTAVWADFNEDLWPDLYLANDVSDNAMFLNNADGTFSDVSHDSWVADYRGAMGVAVGDWDNDLDLDIYIAHWLAQENALYTNLLHDGATGPAAAAGAGRDQGAVPPMPRFRDEADRYGVGQIALDFVGWGTAFFDYDNDGRQDLFVVNGSTLPDPADPARLLPMRPLLFWNRGADGFFEVGAASGEPWTREQVSRGAAVADYDADGDQDLFVVNHGAAPMLLRNDGGNARPWLTVRLDGAPQRDALGARVFVEAGGRSQMRELQSGASYLSQDMREAHFGLGEAARADRLRVRWPDGTEQDLGPIDANQTIMVTQGGGWRPLAPGPAPAAGAPRTGAAVLASPPPGRAATPDREQVRRFWDLYRDGVRAMKQEADWAGAASRFREALALDPDHEDSRYFLGNCLIEQGDFAGALAQFEYLVAVNPQSLRGYLQIGAVHASPDAGALFDLAKAEAALRAALAVNVEESGGISRLGAVLLARGDLAGAGEQLAQVRRLNPRAIDAHYLGGYIAWRQGDAALAAELLARAIELSQPATATPGPPSEGDTRRGDKGALMAEPVRLRPLFAEQLAGLAARPPARALPPAAVEAHYAPLADYLAGLAPAR